MLSKITQLLEPNDSGSPVRRAVLASTSVGRRELFQRLGLPVSLMASHYPEDLDKDMHPIDYVLQTAEGKSTSVFLDLLQTCQPDTFPDLIIAADTMVTLNHQHYHTRHSDIDGSESLRYRIIGKPESNEDAIATLTVLRNQTHFITTGVSFLIPLQASNENVELNASALKQWLHDRLQGYDLSTLLPSSTGSSPLRGLEPVIDVKSITLDDLVQFHSSQHQESVQSSLAPVPLAINTGHSSQSTWYKIHFSSTSSVTFDNIDTDTIEDYVATGEPLGKAGSYAIQGIGGSLIQGLTGCYQNIVGFPTNKFGHILLDLLYRSQSFGTKASDSHKDETCPQIIWAHRV